MGRRVHGNMGRASLELRDLQADGWMWYERSLVGNIRILIRVNFKTLTIFFLQHYKLVFSSLFLAVWWKLNNISHTILCDVIYTKKKQSFNNSFHHETLLYIVITDTQKNKFIFFFLLVGVMIECVSKNVTRDNRYIQTTSHTYRVLINKE